MLKNELDAPLDAVRAKKPARLPVVLTRAEAHLVIDGMTGTYQLMAKLLREAGSGLRLMECLRLRVKDVDFERREITVRDTCTCGAVQVRQGRTRARHDVASQSHRALAGTPQAR